MQIKKMFALLLALMMVFAMAACGGGEDTTAPSSSTQSGSTDPSGTEPSTEPSTAPTGDMEFTVTVKDVLGNPYTENIIVLFLQDGQQVAMQPVNAEGAAIKTLPGGDYDIQLQITKNADQLHYVAEGLKVTAADPSLEILLSSLPEDEYEYLTVNGMERNLYKLTFADDGTFQLEDLNGELSGTYCFTVTDNGANVTDANGNDVGMYFTRFLDGSLAFGCADMTNAQPMTREGEAGDDFTGVYMVASNEYEAAYLRSGCTYLQLRTTERNYFVFTPAQAGIYEFTIHNATATVGYYGSPFFVSTENSGTVSGEQSVTVEIKESMIGSGSTGTTQLVLGIDSENADCIISIARIGDAVITPQEMPWEIYESTHTPSKYTLPEGMTIKEFDLTASYDLVFNEADGFYHLDSADGPVVLVRMNKSLAYGGCFGDILAGMNVGVYFYEEDGTFIRKELYNDCLLQYLGTLNKGMGSHSYSGGMLDDKHGVYPLTQDLMYIIQTYGENAGWWSIGADNYLFDSLVGLNVDSAWLFMCCYASAE